MFHTFPDHPDATGFVSAPDRCLGSWDWSCIEREEGQHGKTRGFLFPQAASKGTTIFCYGLAVVDAVYHFAVYLIGKPFTIETDHKALEFLNSWMATTGRLARWALCLQPFTYKLSGASCRFKEWQCGWISASLGRSQYYNHTIP